MWEPRRKEVRSGAEEEFSGQEGSAPVDRVGSLACASGRPIQAALAQLLSLWLTWSWFLLRLPGWHSQASLKTEAGGVTQVGVRHRPGRGAGRTGAGALSLVEMAGYRSVPRPGLRGRSRACPSSHCAALVSSGSAKPYIQGNALRCAGAAPSRPQYRPEGEGWRFRSRV